MIYCLQKWGEKSGVVAAVRYYMMVEPTFAGTHWCNQCIQGIRKEVSRNKGTLIEVPVGDQAALERVLTQARPLLILVGSLVNWMTETVQRLSHTGIHCIMMTAPPPDGSISVSTISMDYNQGICDLFRYLTQMNRGRVALFGIHPNSINDLTKQQTYCEYVFRHGGNAEGIFHNDGDLREACDRFYRRIREFDAVICSNDIIAIQLQDYLKRHNIRIPEEMYLVSIGETRLSQLVHPRITTASLNFTDIGHNAVRLYNILRKNETITGLHAKVRGTIEAWESTGNVPYEKEPPRMTLPTMPGQSGFYTDENVRRIFMLENLISHCLPIDFAILRGMMDGTPYHRIAEECYTSENAIKYRLRRMVELSQCETKEEMIQLVQERLNIDDLPKE